ncbi:hypothetical protein ABXV14_20510, partial [Atlantibacter hermannii]
TQPVQLTLRAHYICRLATKLTDELYFLQAPLLFLLVEDRTDTAIRTRRVTAQPGDVLLLVFLIADSNGAVADGRMTASVRMPAVATHGYHPARHIAAEAVTDSTAAADAGVRGFELYSASYSQQQLFPVKLLCRNRFFPVLYWSYNRFYLL